MVKLQTPIGDKFMLSACILQKYVVKHKSAKLFMTYAVGKLEAALNIHSLNTKYKQSQI